MTPNLAVMSGNAQLNDWARFADRHVMCFKGAADTHKGTSRDYRTIGLLDILGLAEKPTREPKEKALAILQTGYNGPDGRTHEVQREKGQFTCLCGDFDKDNRSLEDIQTAVDKFFGDNIALLIYSSSSATNENKKWRVVIPLQDVMAFGPWSELMHAWYAFMGAEGFVMDTSLLGAGQPVYMPNVRPELWVDGKPKFYNAHYEDGVGASADTPVVREWIAKLAAERVADDARKAQAKSQAKPRSVASANGIADFNSKHSVEDLMLEAGYEESPRGNDDWRSPCQTTNSYATRVFTDDAGNQYWVSLSGSDADAGLGRATAGGARFGDAFDIYVHFQMNRDFCKAIESLRPPEFVLDFSACGTNTGEIPGKEEASSAATEEGKPKEVSIADVEENPPPTVEFLIEGILPIGVVTMLSGHGGTSKSILSLQVAVCLAMGLPFLGMETRRVKVLVYSAEDGSHIVRYRIANICKRWGIDPKELALHLTVLDASEVDPILFTEKRENSVVAGVPTAAMQNLIDTVGKTGARAVIIDNSSDVYGADEIKRVQVRAFIRMLGKLAKNANAAVLLLAHVDKQAAQGKSTEGYSGSTAWNNSVRSRLYIQDDKAGGLLIDHQKSNYGKRIDPIKVVFDRGVVVLAEEKPENPADRAAFDAVHEIRLTALLGMLDEFYCRGEWIATAQTSPANAYKMLHQEKNFPPGWSRPDLCAALRGLERAKRIEKETYKADSKDRSRWRVTPPAGGVK